MKKHTNKGLFGIHAMLILYTLVPMLLASSILCAFLSRTAQKEVTDAMKNYMLSLIRGAGENISYYLEDETLEEIISSGEMAEEMSLADMIDVDSSRLFLLDTGTLRITCHPDADMEGTLMSQAKIAETAAEVKDSSETQSGILEYTENGTEKYAAYYAGAGWDFMLMLSADKSDVLSELTSTSILTAVLQVLLTILFCAATTPVAKIIASPLKQAAECLDALASGKLEGVHVDAESHVRETCSIIHSTNALSEILSSTVGNIRMQLDAVLAGTEDISARTGNNTENVEQINAAIEEVAQTSQSVAEAAQELAEKAVELGDGVTDLNGSVKNLNAASLDIQNANAEASRCMESVLASSSRSVEAVETIVEELKNTNTAVGDIQTCVSVIDDIAEETKLLSLNASIEAARAGESGRGFDVVAQNIKQLAESSSENAAKIAEIIGRITRLSDESVQAAESVRSTIRGEQGYITEAQQKFTALLESVDRSRQEISAVSENAGRLDTVREKLTAATSDLGAMSEELGASAEEVSASTQTVAGECQETLVSTDAIRTANAGLSEAVGFFH